MFSPILLTETVKARIEHVANRLSPQTIEALNTGGVSPGDMTAVKEAVIGMLPTLAQVIDSPESVKIVQAVEERIMNLIAENYVRVELDKTMREMYRLTAYNSIVTELEAITASPAAARVAELKAQHEAYRAKIQTALDEFAELANEYADEQDACGQFERAMSVLWAIAPRGHDSMPRRTATISVNIVEYYTVDAPRGDDGYADTSELDADYIRENGDLHGEEIETH